MAQRTIDETGTQRKAFFLSTVPVTEKQKQQLESNLFNASADLSDLPVISHSTGSELLDSFDNRSVTTEATTLCQNIPIVHFALDNSQQSTAVSHPPSTTADLPAQPTGLARPVKATRPAKAAKLKRVKIKSARTKPAKAQAAKPTKTARTYALERISSVIRADRGEAIL